MLCLVWLFPTVAAARLLAVGPGRTISLPSQAALVARDGDTIRIDPGTYRDCAVWQASRLSIEASGPGVRIAGKTCAGVAIFLFLGNDVSVTGITFADAKVVGDNGAGIKMTGDNLTVTDSLFLHDQNGILAGGSARSIVRVANSVFIGNGACIMACAHAVYAGAPIRLLDIERCVFLDTRTAHHIKSRAHTTLVRDSRIEDGPEGTASYLIETPNGGNLLVEDNFIEKGPNSGNPSVAISIGVEGVSNWTGLLVIRDNQFRNDLPVATVFVRNRSRTPVRLIGNQVSGPVEMLEGPGAVERPE